MSNVSSAITRTGGSSIEREGFGSHEVERRHETASTAMAAAMRAAIEARCVMAIQRPRNDDQVRVRLLKECARPNFAAKAWYQVPRRGAKPGKLTKTPGVIEGLSVRFAESAIRMAGNLDQKTTILYDDDFKRLIMVQVVDLETNAAYSRDLVLEKTIERREPKDKDRILGQRTNADGEIVYIVQATEEDLLTKESNLVSRMFRTEALRFIPADTLEECERAVIATCYAEDKKDPDAARKAVADTFATVNVMPADLIAYLGHDLGQCSPAELLSLKGLFGAIRDGAVTWAEALAERQSESGGDGKKTVAQKLAERAKAKSAGPQAPPASNEGAKPEPKTGTPAQGAQAPQGEPQGTGTPQGPKATAKAPLAASQKAPDPPAGTGPAASGQPSGVKPVPPVDQDIPKRRPDLCVLCEKSIDFDKDGVATETADGVRGFRHQACNPDPFGLGAKKDAPDAPEAADAEPPPGVRTIGGDDDDDELT